eukprot:3932725-Rhodomonas_salina.1
MHRRRLGNHLQKCSVSMSTNPHLDQTLQIRKTRLSAAMPKAIHSPSEVSILVNLARRHRQLPVSESTKRHPACVIPVSFWRSYRNLDGHIRPYVHCVWHSTGEKLSGLLAVVAHCRNLHEQTSTTRTHTHTDTHKPKSEGQKPYHQEGIRHLKCLSMFPRLASARSPTDQE